MGTKIPDGGERWNCTQRYTVITQVISALRWAARRQPINSSVMVRGKVTRQQCLRERVKSRSGGVKPMLFAYQPNALLLGQTGSSVNKRVLHA